MYMYIYIYTYSIDNVSLYGPIRGSVPRYIDAAVQLRKHARVNASMRATGMQTYRHRCMDESMHACMGAWMHACIDTWMHIPMDA